MHREKTEQDCRAIHSIEVERKARIIVGEASNAGASFLQDAQVARAHAHEATTASETPRLDDAKSTPPQEIRALLDRIGTRYSFVGSSLREDVYLFTEAQKAPKLRLRHLRHKAPCPQSHIICDCDSPTTEDEAWEVTQKEAIDRPADDPYLKSATAYHEKTYTPEDPLNLYEALLNETDGFIRHKHKEGWVFKGKDQLSIEVWFVQHLGWFLEIEVLLDGDQGAQLRKDAEARVQETFAYLGFSPSDWVDVPYLTLIQEAQSE